MGKEDFNARTEREGVIWIEEIEEIIEKRENRRGNKKIRK